MWIAKGGVISYLVLLLRLWFSKNERQILRCVFSKAQKPEIKAWFSIPDPKSAIIKVPASRRGPAGAYFVFLIRAAAFDAVPASYNAIDRLSEA